MLHENIQGPKANTKARCQHRLAKHIDTAPTSLDKCDRNKEVGTQRSLHFFATFNCV